MARILITAGPTREYIDPVRYLSNDSSGRMGWALAEAATARGHDVTLIAGPVELPPPTVARFVKVVSAAEMLTAAQAEWPHQDALIMAAAVADYRVAAPLTVKHKKQDEAFTLKLTPTVDILATLAAAKRPNQLVIGFALEDVDGRTRAAEKLRRKQLDGIVLNSPAAIGAAASTVEVFDRRNAWQSLPHADKRATAAALLDWIAELTS